MLQSKSLQTSDYKELKEAVHLIGQTKANHPELASHFRYPHEHREWEYASALQAHLDKWKQTETNILDVGAGSSLLGPTLAEKASALVEEIELEPRSIGVDNLVSIKKSVMDLTGVKYDSVFCISVIEHIDVWRQAFQNLMDSVKPKGLLVVTTDYGENKTLNWYYDELRTHKFVEEDMAEMKEMLLTNNFELNIDFTYHGPMVFDYTFFRIVAERC